MPELSAIDSGGKKRLAAAGAPKVLRFAAEAPGSPHALGVAFRFGLQLPSDPLTRNDRSDNDLDSFAEGVTSVEHSWIDDRELPHRYPSENSELSVLFISKFS
jgi:hypothetical protein